MDKTIEFSNGYLIDLTTVMTVSPTFAMRNQYVLMFVGGYKESITDDIGESGLDFIYPREEFVAAWKRARE
jgi:hypothetical protein